MSTDEIDRFMTSPILFEIIVTGMLKRLRNEKQKFIFNFCILDGHPQKLAAEILGIHETNVAREIRRIRTYLVPYADGYDIGSRYVKKNKDSKTM